MGVLYAREGGVWVPVPPGPPGPEGPEGPEGPQGIPGVATVTTPLLIPDPVGVNYPALRFSEGDGANGTGPNPYHYEFNLYSDRLRLFSNRQPSVPIAEFGLAAVDKQLFKLGAWEIECDASGYMRWYHTTDRTNTEFSINSAGDGYFRGNLGVIGAANITGAANVGSVSATGRLYGNDLHVGGGYVYGQTNLILTSNGAGYASLDGYSAQCGVQPGNAWGGGNFPKVGIYSANVLGGLWQYRPLSVHKTAGAGEVGMAFVNNANGWTGGLQLYSDGSMYLGVLNGDNTAYIKSYAASFNVISARHFKSEIVDLGSRARRIFDHLNPVRYRDLQHELAFNAGSTANYPDGTVREPPVVEPRYRYGFVAEDVFDVAGYEMVDDSELGKGYDLSGMVAVLWKVVKELADELKDVRQELADIKGAAT